MHLIAIGKEIGNESPIAQLAVYSSRTSFICGSKDLDGIVCQGPHDSDHNSIGKLSLATSIHLTPSSVTVVHEFPQSVRFENGLSDWEVS